MKQKKDTSNKIIGNRKFSPDLAKETKPEPPGKAWKGNPNTPVRSRRFQLKVNTGHITEVTINYETQRSTQKPKYNWRKHSKDAYYGQK